MWAFINKTLAHCLSPKKFLALAGRMMPWITIVFLATFTYGLISGLFFTPPDAVQGDGFRIIYIHVPSAFLSLFIYAVMACAAMINLVFRAKITSMVIRHSAPIGACFTLLALVTGSLWGKPMWGTWWIWDARLTSELILLFLYVAVILYQAAMTKRKSAERAVSILVVIGFIDIPIIHYSVYWWNTLHQGATLKLFGPSLIDTSMLYPLLAMITAFIFYYFMVLFTRLRHDIIALQSNHHWLARQK